MKGYPGCREDEMTLYLRPPTLHRTCFRGRLCKCFMMLMIFAWSVRFSSSQDCLECYENKTLRSIQAVVAIGRKLSSLAEATLLISGALHVWLRTREELPLRNVRLKRRSSCTSNRHCYLNTGLALLVLGPASEAMAAESEASVCERQDLLLTGDNLISPWLQLHPELLSRYRGIASAIITQAFYTVSYPVLAG